MTPRTFSHESLHKAAKDIHVSGVITIVLELCLCVENFLPVLVVFCWRRPGERTVGDKLVAALSATYILSALVPTPLGLASYFHGSWYGGTATCECFQVTSTWCSLSALTIVTFLSVTLHATTCTRARAALTSGSCSTCICSCPGGEGWGGCRAKDYANLLLFFIFIITLAIASLPVAGYGPEIMPQNNTCDSWLIDTPDTAKRRTYFIAFLSFGFLNLLIVIVCVPSTCVALKRLSRLAAGDHFRYTEEQSPPLIETDDLDNSYKMAGLIFANQAMWIPALAMITLQKIGYSVSDATVMYSILTTSLPGLLNPVLLGLLFRDYRHGYRYVITRSCCCSNSGAVDSNSLKNLQYRSEETLAFNHTGDENQPPDPRHVFDDATSSRTRKVYSASAGASTSHDEFDGHSCQDCKSYVVVEHVVVSAPDERTPLQGASGASSRPIVASMYDEYGELSQATKTELLSPCGSEECLISPSIFRAQSESVV